MKELTNRLEEEVANMTKVAKRENAKLQQRVCSYKIKFYIEPAKQWIKLHNK